MRQILRRHEIVADDWRYPAELPAGASAADSVIVPLAEFRENAAVWQAFQGRLGLRIAPAIRVEDLAGDLPRLKLIAFELPGPGEGRGYTAARLLRQRYGFTGEIRAVGVVKQDQIFLLARSGFDAFELAPGEDIQEAASALQRYSIAYQPGAVIYPGIERQRFFA
jgi:uncharacterized protein (DUF934 family)